MKIFFSAIHLLVFSTLGKSQTCDDDPYIDACSMHKKDGSNDADVLTVTCPEGGTCTCAAESKVSCSEVDDALVAEGDMSNADRCRMLCGIQSSPNPDKKCYFYRWDKIHADDNTVQYVCKMRSCETQCVGADPCIDCTDCTTDEGNICETGHISTEGGALPKPDDDVPVPCPGDFVYDVNKIHWRCVDTDESQASDRSILGSVLNPYMDPDLPHNAICFTTKRCSAWDANKDGREEYRYKLVARCNGNGLTGEEPNQAGTWIVDKQLTGSEEITKKMIVDNKLSEPDLADVADCTTICQPFVLDESVRDQPGVEVFCNDPLEEWTIKDGNSCILLCDQELTHSVSCVYNSEDGSKKWKDGQGSDIAEEQFICGWSK